MRYYHCPYCNTSIQHRPHYAGERVICSKCQGAYFEPTDPLPGVKPEKAPPVDDSDQTDTPDRSANQAKLAAAKENAGQGIHLCEPSDMVAELTRRGQNAVLLFWKPDTPDDAGLAYSKNLNRQQADDQLIQVAAHVLQKRWPDLHQLMMHRLSKP